jgi:hypothetical protein
MESSYKITIIKNTFYIQPSATNTYKSNNAILKRIQIIMKRHLEYRLPANLGLHADEFTDLTPCGLNLRLKEIAKKSYEACKRELKKGNLLSSLKMVFLEKRYNAILNAILPEFSQLPDELKEQIISYLKFDLQSLCNLCLVDRSSNFIANALKKQLAIEWGYRGEETENEASKIALYLKEACCQFGVLKILKMDKILVTRNIYEKMGSLIADTKISKTISNFYSLSHHELDNLKERYKVWQKSLPLLNENFFKGMGKKIQYLQSITKKHLIQLLIKHGADPNLLENGKTWQEELKEHPENKKYFFSTGKWPENMPKNALALAIDCREYELIEDLI